MHTRKVQSVGGGTYTVSLPKEWADSQGISAGDIVGLHTHIDGVLAIQPGESGTTSPRTVTVDVSGDGSATIEPTVRAAYAAGTKELYLESGTGFSTAQTRVLERIARNLPGVSVVEQSESSRRIQMLLDTHEISVRQSVRQLSFVALSMHRNGTAGLASGEDFQDVPDRHDQASRLFAIVDRAFGRALCRLDEIDALATERPELFALWQTARELERVADEAGAIARARASEESRPPPPREIVALASDARAVVADAVGVVVGDTHGESAREILRTREDVCRRIETLDDGLTDPGSRSSVRSVLAGLRRTADHGGTIAEVGLRMALREGGLSSTGDTDGATSRPSQPSTED